MIPGLPWKPLCLAILTWLAPAAGALPLHDGLHEQIEAATQAIAADPDNALLYLQRAELHRLHKDFDAAVADLRRTQARDPQAEPMDLVWSRLLMDLDRLPMALRFLDRHLSNHPDEADGYLLRARILAVREEDQAAARAYGDAIERLAAPAPEHYLARAELMARSDPDGAEAALRVLDEGVDRLGPVASLQLAALELEVSMQRTDAALQRLDTLMAASPRQERWLARRGDVLRRAGRATGAGQAYRAALHAIVSLRPRHRQTRAVATLEARVRADLEQLEAGAVLAAKGTDP